MDLRLGSCLTLNAPSVETRVTLSLKAGALVVNFDCEGEPAPCLLTERDAPLWEEEVVEVFIAPGLADPEEYYEFEVNPKGALWDGRIMAPNLKRDHAWTNDASWDCKGVQWGAELTVAGWKAALAIPLRELTNGGPLPNDWRVNFFRIHRPAFRPYQLLSWKPTFEENFHCPQLFGAVRLSSVPAAL